MVMPPAASRCSLLRLPRRAHSFIPASRARPPSCSCRAFTTVPPLRHDAASPESRRASVMADWARYRDSCKLPLENGYDKQYVGSMGKQRHVSKKLSFADVILPSGQAIQICSRADDDAEAHAKFRAVPAHSPVLVRVREDPTEADNTSAKPTFNLESIQPLNSVPDHLIVTPETIFPPNKRHLQIRFHPELQARLRFRSWLKGVLNQSLLEKGFTDVETPTLFKTTPEGAREFLVPTRTPRKAYALTQSPQQYKQSLIASGIGRYMQWARCYRDEDSRADRQPEFTQLDMEWAFAGKERVQKDITDIVLNALSKLRPAHSYQDVRGERVPILSEIPNPPAAVNEPQAHCFTSLTFAECIQRYGIDKPDLRIPGRIHQLDIQEKAQNFVGMISHLSDPLVEAFTFSLNESSPEASRTFIAKFMKEFEASSAPKEGEAAGDQPQILIHDSSKPLSGFSSIGFEYEDIVAAASGGAELKDGDLVIFQARPTPKGQYTSSSTSIGEFRVALWKALVEEGLLTKPRLGDPGSLQFLWVTEFPMFKPVGSDEPWLSKEANAGIAACHHPFTAPLSTEDMELLFTNPLEAKSAAYDLVLNGTEVGGGSERNHVASIQKFIMEDVIKMDPRWLCRFEHLFAALSSGCPPHAGFALGFDRLVALLTDTGTVRDVIAFPKTVKGEDVFVGSPSKLTNDDLEPLGLAFRSKKTE